MSQKEIKFCITGEEDGMQVHIEGGARDLTNLLANAIAESDEIEMLVTMSLLAVHMKRKEEDGDDDSLKEFLSKMKPTAQA